MTHEALKERQRVMWGNGPHQRPYLLVTGRRR
jgi:hypothetical protein